jgi:hypothetical protein
MKKTLAVLGIATLFVACGQKPSAPATTATAATTSATQTYASDDPTQPPPAQQAKLSGTVAETMNGGGYTYIKLKTAQGESWIATPQAEVTQGQQVTIVPQMTAKDFESVTLKRKFDEIVFGTIENGATSNAQNGAAMGSPSDHMQAQAPVANVKVDKAEGANAKTVAEIWSGKAALANQPVVVRGTVVKSLAGIMGKNWLHLRDGSGSAEKGDHDITVTTNGTAKVGQVVVVSGTVRVDKDFGAGYVYPAIIEDASIK